MPEQTTSPAAQKAAEMRQKRRRKLTRNEALGSLAQTIGEYRNALTQRDAEMRVIVSAQVRKFGVVQPDGSRLLTFTQEDFTMPEGEKLSVQEGANGELSYLLTLGPQPVKEKPAEQGSQDDTGAGA